MGDGGHLVERDERHLVVRVVVEAVERHLADQPRRAHDGRRLGELSAELPALVVEGEREGEDEGDDGEDAVQVRCTHVLAHWLIHRGLREHRARGEGHVGGDRANQRLPGEGELLEGGEGDAADDGEEGGVDGPLEHSAEHEVRQDAREDRLGRLHRLSERHRAGAEGDHGASVAKCVRGADRHEHLPPARVELGRLAQARCPQEENVRDANEERDHGHCPRHREGVLALLVGDVVHDVEEEPGEEAEAEAGRAHE
mmetsp:Transcript_1293/g.3655  ORF Transcript_1293/g.3655 Transcript_1293/m.3655 type:complete len:256 (+) Transcript_1293:654-1421(+)